MANLLRDKMMDCHHQWSWGKEKLKIWRNNPERKQLAVAFAAGTTLFLSSLANFLSHNAYPYLRPEVGFFAFAIIITCALMAFFYRAQRQWGRSFLEGLLIALFFDLNTDSIALIALGGIGVAAYTYWRRTSFLEPLSLIGTIILILTAAGLGARTSWIDDTVGEASTHRAPSGNQKPAIFHIILDEHIGIEGLPDDARGRRIRDELRSFYLANKFVLYGGAYSQHYNTVNAIPGLLNFGGKSGQRVGKNGARTGRTKYLQSLVDQGYRLTIFQSDFVDYCTDADFAECITYHSSSPRPTLDVPMGTADRAGLLTAKFLGLSSAVSAASTVWNMGAVPLRTFRLSMPLQDTYPAQSSTVGALEAMNKLTQLFSRAQPGDAIFAHLLLPHFPYVVGGDCKYLPWSRWEGQYVHSTVETRRRAYYDQLHCTARKLEELLRAISRSPAGDLAVVIIHGDHGSRIVRVSPNAENYGRIDDADMVAGFSTLFAIRAPSVAPGYFEQRLPIVPLLHEFTSSKFKTAPRAQPPSAHMVYLADEDWHPVRQAPLPTSWTKGFDRPVAGH